MKLIVIGERSTLEIDKKLVRLLMRFPPLLLTSIKAYRRLLLFVMITWSASVSCLVRPRLSHILLPQVPDPLVLQRQRVRSDAFSEPSDVGEEARGLTGRQDWEVLLYVILDVVAKIGFAVLYLYELRSLRWRKRLSCE